MKYKYKKVMDLSSRKAKFLKHLLSYMRRTLHTEEKKPHDIFTLPSHALPSQYRTLLPVKDVEIERLLALERRRRIIRNATLTISAIIVVFIIIVITLIIVLQLSLDNESLGPLRLTAVHVNRTHFQVDEIKLLKTKAMVKSSKIPQKALYDSAKDDKMRCIAKCWEYAAFRFKAECVSGQCICRDSNYDSLTCLPKTRDCTIRKHRYHPSFQAVHHGLIQPSFSCAPKQDTSADVPTKATQTDLGPEIHVISIYGDRDTKLTRLHFKSSRKVNATLILVSYEPVTWNITLDDSVHTQKIVLISHYGVSRTQVKIASHSNRATGNGNASTSSPNIGITPSSPSNGTSKTSEGSTSNIPSPIQVKRLLIRTGYGDDRDSGSTPFLLDQITKKIGPISSFFGVAHAENIEFDIGLGNYELNSMSEEEKSVYKTLFET